MRYYIKPSIPHHGGKNTTGHSTKENFTYDKDKDRYTCPQGNTLRNHGFVRDLRHYIYRANPRDCKQCKFLRQCTKSPAGRSITRHVNERFLEQAKEHLKTALARATITQRGSYTEPAFACQKKDLGLERAKFRGLMSVHIQSVLTAASYNLKKLVKYSKGFTEKLKSESGLPVLPISETDRVELRHKIRENELVPVWALVRNSSFSLLRRILGLRLVYIVT